MPTVTRRLEWDAAHRVLKHESKCGTLHGHHYVALITCEANSLDACDRVIDFGVIKNLVGSWIDDHWDHTTLVNCHDAKLIKFCDDDHVENGKRQSYAFDGEPTAEVIAQKLLSIAQRLLSSTGVRVVEVEVYETPNCSAKVRAPK